MNVRRGVGAFLDVMPLAALGMGAVIQAEQAGDSFEPAALHVLDEIFGQAEAAGRIDELGNGRFARSLFERACACRDLRVVRLGEMATAADLTTLTSGDVRGAYAELTV